MGREEGGGLRMGNTCIPVVEKKKEREKDEWGLVLEAMVGPLH